MNNLDEKIRNVMAKDIKSKTILIDKENKEKIVEEHIKEGWTLVNTVDLNNKVKVTFQMVK